MSEETPKITTEVKTKNPGRVAAGKRLAEISKAARERKKQEKIEQEITESNSLSDKDSLFTHQNILALTGLGIGVAALFYELRPRKAEKPQHVVINTKRAHLLTTRVVRLK